MYGRTYGSPVVGWPGIFRFIEDHSFTPNPKWKPTSIHGLISLFPKRKDRWIETRQLGPTCLDVYYCEYAAGALDQILAARVNMPLLFWGGIRRRHSPHKDEWPLYPHTIDIDGFSLDTSKGRQSPLRAIASASSIKELLGES